MVQPLRQTPLSVTVRAPSLIMEFTPTPRPYARNPTLILTD